MEAKVRRQIILLSILLHILFLAFWESFIKLDISQAFSASPPAAAKSAPLVFDLQQPELPRGGDRHSGRCQNHQAAQKSRFFIR